ncbi:hypothetical protein D3C81_1595720 [compost metagenome]
MRGILFGNSAARILNEQTQGIVAIPGNPQRNGSPLRRVFDCIIQKNIKQLVNLLTVPHTGEGFCRVPQVQLQMYVFLICH